jgi:hypothetical protein
MSRVGEREEVLVGVVRIALVGVGMLPLLWGLVGCGDPAEQCAGNIEVVCDQGGCFCATGAYEGEQCVDEPNSTDPDACENLCCGEGEGLDGPPSILKGTM